VRGDRRRSAYGVCSLGLLRFLLVCLVDFLSQPSFSTYCFLFFVVVFCVVCSCVELKCVLEQDRFCSCVELKCVLEQERKLVKRARLFGEGGKRASYKNSYSTYVSNRRCALHT